MWQWIRPECAWIMNPCLVCDQFACSSHGSRIRKNDSQTWHTLSQKHHHIPLVYHVWKMEIQMMLSFGIRYYKLWSILKPITTIFCMGPFLLTWANLNSSMTKQFHPLYGVGRKMSPAKWRPLSQCHIQWTAPTNKERIHLGWHAACTHFNFNFNKVICYRL